VRPWIAFFWGPIRAFRAWTLIGTGISTTVQSDLAFPQVAAVGNPNWTVSEEISAGGGPANSHELKLQQIHRDSAPVRGMVSSIPDRSEGDSDGAPDGSHRSRGGRAPSQEEPPGQTTLDVETEPEHD
jgi:hypothetical protein